jgi:hypothetical protein
MTWVITGAEGTPAAAALGALTVAVVSAVSAISAAATTDRRRLLRRRSDLLSFEIIRFVPLTPGCWGSMVFGWAASVTDGDRDRTDFDSLHRDQSFRAE